MSILSITFHTVESQLQTWEQYFENELITLVENFIDVEKYILSEVNTEMLTEGKNTNTALPTMVGEVLLLNFCPLFIFCFSIKHLCYKPPLRQCFSR